MPMNPATRSVLRRGVVIPASPLALTARRTLDERRQRALWRYYIAAGAGGIAVGVHTTQFAIRDPTVGLFEPVLALAADEISRADAGRSEPLLRIGGVCGRTEQAAAEAALLRRLGYHAGLLSLAALPDADDETLIRHCRTVADIIPVIGFYLQPAVGGRVLPYRFWRRFVEIDEVVAVKIAPFNRYQTLDVLRAVADSGRQDLALYTGNDDHIVLDLLTVYRPPSARPGSPDPAEAADHSSPAPDGGSDHASQPVRIVGGLLGHWAVWTRPAVELLDRCHAAVDAGARVPPDLLGRGTEVTDCNAAFFDAANGFAGCIAGLHEVLRRQGLLEGVWCLDPRETLSPGQAEEIDRVYRAYPHLNDDEFVAAHRDDWLRR
jgi:hypothetical protein